jgi:voltage-gated potassium channel Kch
MLDELTNHFILCGYGRIGSIIADELRQQGVPFVVIERNPDRLQSALARGWLAVEADASEEGVLRRIGIDRARGLIAAVGTDAENVYTVLTARELRRDLFIIARVESDGAEHRLRRAGANRVISPYQIGATHMVQTALRPAVVDFVQLVRARGSVDPRHRHPAEVWRDCGRDSANRRHDGVQSCARVGDSGWRRTSGAGAARTREGARGDGRGLASVGRMTAR